VTWIETALAHIASRTPVALVTLTDVKGSAPRDAGARMIVWANGQAGTIGGGNLEFMVVREARALLEDETLPPLPRGEGAGGEGPSAEQSLKSEMPSASHQTPYANIRPSSPCPSPQGRRGFVLERDYPLGPILGQCCGGRVSVRIERLGSKSKTWLKQQLLAEEVGKTPLLIFGAGHVGQAIAHAIAPLPFALAWFDTRREYATEAKYITDPRVIVAAAPERAFYLIVTHNHDLDYELTRTVLARGDGGYCGLIGSHSKRRRFERQLRADGVPSVEIERLVCPIGGALAIKDKSPPVIAAAVAAEMLLVREEVLHQAREAAAHVE
jgi:xanthine dehydrogenase accessory protein XdhC